MQRREKKKNRRKKITSLVLATVYPTFLAAIAPLDTCTGWPVGDEESRQVVKEAVVPSIFVTGYYDKDDTSYVHDSRHSSLAAWNDLLDMNNCGEYAVTQEESDFLHNYSLNTIEQVTAVRYEQTEVILEENTRIYYSTFTNSESGVCTLATVMVDQKGHFPSGYDAELGWEFMRHFSRDVETGESIYTP